MQLPSFSASTDVNLSPFLAATGETAITARGATAMPAAGDFGELLADSGAPLALEKKPAAVPTDATTAMLISSLPFPVVTQSPPAVDGSTETIALTDCGADGATAVVADNDAGAESEISASPRLPSPMRSWEKFAPRGPAPQAASAPSVNSTPAPRAAMVAASDGETEVTDETADHPEYAAESVSPRASIAAPACVAPEITAFAVTPLAVSPVSGSSVPSSVPSVSPQRHSTESTATSGTAFRSNEPFATNSSPASSMSSPTTPVGRRSISLATPAIDEAAVATNSIVASATDIVSTDAIVATNAVPASRPTFAGDFASRYLTPTARPPLTAVPEQAAQDFDATDIGDIRAMVTPPVVTAPPVARVADDFVRPLSVPTSAPQTRTAPSVAEAETSAVAQNSAPADHAETSFAGGGENFAAPDKNFGARKSSALGAEDKTFLRALDKRVTAAPSDLGTDVAKPSSAMSVPNYFDRPATAAVLEHEFVSVAPVATVESFVPAAPLIASDATGAAHRAVDAVLTAAERFSAGDRHSVNLQFSVGGADLSVRVELLAGEVRTVFRTDSPELRAALAHEWRAESNGAADRSLRLADPVFASANSSGTGSFAGDNASRQHDSNARHSADEQFQTTLSRLRPAGISASSATVAVAAAPRIAAPVTTLHLHALA